MSAKNQIVTIEVPWRPGSKIRIRPMSIADERAMLSDSDESYSYYNMAMRCIIDTEGLDMEKDFGRSELDLVLINMRIITYGEDMILSGYKCPHCNHVNKNHKVSLNEYRILEGGVPELELKRSSMPDNATHIRVQQVSVSRQREIDDKIVEISKSKSEKGKLDTWLLTYMKLAIFPDYDLDVLVDLADNGDLSLLDIARAQQLLLNSPYGFDYNDKMICHQPECKKEFDIIKFVPGPGLFVPCLD